MADDDGGKPVGIAKVIMGSEPVGNAENAP
jgi:hypothetical protein